MESVKVKLNDTLRAIKLLVAHSKSNVAGDTILSKVLELQERPLQHFFYDAF